ncbi:uncharacterized protein LOC114254351 [Monomorium pharaonis]|uniref:uncharacterized protein LOC114254351 n=1 Tax=Monomorium pharaonis TaxID=307658 RepID=UPI001745CBBE|nr:uncharacterized protein LOC114254351 [Monomorium pharaonis]
MSHFIDKADNASTMLAQKVLQSKKIKNCFTSAKENNFKEQLVSVFLKTGINHVQAKEILKLLRTHSCFSKLPRDPRTIMNTPRVSCCIDNIAGGQYLHLGFDEGIKAILQITPLSMIPNNLEIDFHIDGASLDSASNIQLYPIQIRIANIYQSKPEIVGVWKGSSKPTSATEFLKPFVNDVLQVKNNKGIIFNGKKLTFKLRCFIADAIARAFVLGHQGPKSQAPCSKCWLSGINIRQGVIVFSGVDHRLRTNEEYIMCLDGEHHKEEECSIVRLSIDLVNQSVFYYMHLICLGVMEKIFLAIVDGKYASSAKLSPTSIKNLSTRLESVKKFCPKEFTRKPINVTKHRTFKATEHRQILLYTGPIIFYELLNESMYLHFLLLHSAICILVDVISCKNTANISKAELMLKIFVQRVPEHYGIEFLSYNVHGLLHLANDAKNFGPLDSFSPFPYENNMSYFKKICRKPNQHLQQIANRRYEEKRLQEKFIFSTEDFIQVSGLHKHGPMPAINFHHYSQYRNLLCRQFTLSLNGKDDTIILKDSSICIVQNIIGYDNKYYLIVKRFHRIENFYHTLVQSSDIGIFHCSLLFDELIIINFDQIAGKCFKLPLCSVMGTINSNDYVIVKILFFLN